MEPAGLTAHAGLQWLRAVDGGADWLSRLPDLVADCCRNWQLVPGEPFPYAYASLALPVTRADGTSAVLKVQWPDRESKHEAGALEAWNGRGAVRLLAHNPEVRALLIERCLPGTPLADEKPDVALEVLTRLFSRLWIEPPADMPTLGDEVAHWRQSLSRRWEAAGHQADRQLIDAALEAMDKMAGTQGPPVLLHQDLHAANVLRAEREPWLVIDPKPLVGEREFGVAPIVRGAELGHSREAVLARLNRVCASLGLDRERARQWTIAQTMAWATMDPSDPASQPHLDVVRWLLEA